MTLRPGAFIVIEGGEGSGKTSAMAVLATTLQSRGHDVLQTREPGGTPEGLTLRGLLLAEEGPDWDPAAELLLMTAARVQHVRRVIAPALAAAQTVLCDRFVGSTLAYQGAGRGLSTALILDLHRRFVDDLWPSLTVLLDVAPQTGLARSRRRLGHVAADEGRFEALDLDFHGRVRASFLEQAAARPSLVIDAGQVLDTVQRDLVDGLSTWIGRGIVSGGRVEPAPRAPVS